MLFSDSAGIQTLDLQNRNLTLYSAKLRDLKFKCSRKIKQKKRYSQISVTLFSTPQTNLSGGFHPSFSLLPILLTTVYYFSPHTNLIGSTKQLKTSSSDKKDVS